MIVGFFFFKQKTAYEMRISDWSSDVCSSDLGTIRRLLDRRLRSKRGVKDRGLGRRSYAKRLTADDLLRVYQREADKQRLLARKADFTQARLLFIVEAMKDLLADEGFTTLLRAEGLVTMPQALTARIEGEGGKGRMKRQARVWRLASSAKAGADRKS